MPKLHEQTREIAELEISPFHLAAFIERMQSISEAEARLVRLLEEDINVSERLIGFLIGVRPRGFCDRCIAYALTLSLEVVKNHAEELANRLRFYRAVGRCSSCRSTRRIVTRAAQFVDSRASSTPTISPISYKRSVTPAVITGDSQDPMRTQGHPRADQLASERA